jgi:hypothetical protein
MSRPGAVAIANPDRALTPVAIVRQPRPGCDAHSESEDRIGIEGWTVNEHDLGLVVRNVNDVGLRRHDSNNLWLRDDLLLGRIGKRASRPCFFAQVLYRLHHVG